MQQSNVRKWNNTEITNQPAAADYIPVSLADGTAVWVPFSSMGGGTDLTDAIVKAPDVSGRNLITHPTSYAGLEIKQTSVTTTSPSIVLKFMYGASLVTGMNIYPNAVVIPTNTVDTGIVRFSGTTRDTHAITGYTSNSSGGANLASAGVYGRGESTGNFGVVGEAISPASAGVKGTSHSGGAGVFGTGTGNAGLFQKSSHFGTKATLVAKRVASQTENLQEWQDESGEVLSAVDKNGGPSGALDLRARRVMSWEPWNYPPSVLGFTGLDGNNRCAPNGSLSSFADSTGSYLNYSTGATTDSDAGFYSFSGTLAICLYERPTLIFAMKTGPDITNTRHLFGLATSWNTMTSSTTPTSSIMFRYATDVDGSAYWRFIHRYTGTTSVTTSVAVAANTRYVFKLVATSATSVEAYINGTLVGTATSNLPDPDQALFFPMQVRTLANEDKSLRFAKLYIERD